MKFANLNPSNVKNLIPSWAGDVYQLMTSVDGLLTELFSLNRKMKPANWDRKLGFWIDANLDTGKISVQVPDHEVADKLYLGKLVIDTGPHTIVLPLNAMMKGSAELRDMHCVYSHSILTETPLTYIGITKQRWFDRWAQHKRSAETGSGYIFHSALRQHIDCRVVHKVLLCELPYDAAMHFEEEFVNECSLYPIGLNMIPGGFAGLKYLHKLGISAKSAAERDAAIESVASRENIDGKPNPLCAARWASDQDYINRVICGHSGRLTVDQVRSIRLLSQFDKSANEISLITGANLKQVLSVSAGKYYGKVI